MGRQPRASQREASAATSTRASPKAREEAGKAALSLEVTEFLFRSDAATFVIKSGMPRSKWNIIIVQKTSLVSVAKQIMACFRRFMLLNMGSANATIAAVTAAAVEEALDSVGDLKEVAQRIADDWLDRSVSLDRKERWTCMYYLLSIRN